VRCHRGTGAGCAGESGELCLGGSQVTGGYLNDPEKTAKSFVRLAHTGDQIWYRTGIWCGKTIAAAFLSGAA